MQDFEVGTRIDVFLSEKDKSISRSSWQKLIKLGHVKINNKNVKSNYILKAGDEIFFELPDKKNKIEENKSKENWSKKVQIVKKTKDYLIINKPAGLIVHAASDKDDRFSLVDFLLSKHPEVRKIGEDPGRPGIVHRLDKDVSGLMIVAVKQDFFDYAKKLFKKRLIEKRYLALVFGKIEKDTGEINFPLERSKEGKIVARSTKQGGKTAITEFFVKKRFINYTLVEVKIKTGRTHQIRAHFSAFNHPLVGDNLHTTKEFREKNKKMGLKRIFLFSQYLSFLDLKGEKREFFLDWPQEFKEFVENKVK